jgi:hypothetical protein
LPPWAGIAEACIGVAAKMNAVANARAAFLFDISVLLCTAGFHFFFRLDFLWDALKLDAIFCAKAKICNTLKAVRNAPAYDVIIVESTKIIREYFANKIHDKYCLIMAQNLKSKLNFNLLFYKCSEYIIMNIAVRE